MVNTKNTTHGASGTLGDDELMDEKKDKVVALDNTPMFGNLT